MLGALSYKLEDDYHGSLWVQQGLDMDAAAPPVDKRDQQMKTDALASLSDSAARVSFKCSVCIKRNA